MASDDRPQIYLVTPPAFEPERFGATLAGLLDRIEIACIRLALASGDEDGVGRAADALREIAHARDVALVIEAHARIALRHGLDGVHLIDGARSIRYVRKELGADAIIGAYCGTSRHEGMNAAEAGADYVSFGPVGESLLGTGSPVEMDVFEWWSEIIEVPVVAEGALTPDLVAKLAPVTDFFAIGPEIWSAPDPEAALKALLAPLG